MKIKKVILSVLLLLCFSIITPTFAKEDLARLVDDANILTEDEKNNLTSTLNEISERQNIDVVVVTVESLKGKDIAEYADDFYDVNRYGYGDKNDGILLLLSMSESKWYISTSGYGITAFTDSGIKYISDKFLPILKDKKYEKAFLTYANLCDEFISQAKNAQPYDSGNMPKSNFDFLKTLGISALVGAVVSFIATSSMKKSLKSVEMQSLANDYMNKNKININQSQDIFLYNTITKTEKSKESKGSSTHTSSSGKTHGGGGGNF